MQKQCDFRDLPFRSTAHKSMSVFRFRKAQRCIKNPVKHLKMEYFAKTVNDIQPLTIFAKLSLLVVWQGSEYTSELWICKILSENWRFLTKEERTSCNSYCDLSFSWKFALVLRSTIYIWNIHVFKRREITRQGG